MLVKAYKEVEKIIHGQKVVVKVYEAAKAHECTDDIASMVELNYVKGLLGINGEEPQAPWDEESEQ